MDRQRVLMLYRPLVIGPILLAGVAAFLLRTSGPIGRQPMPPLVAWVMGAMVLGEILLALLWARPQVPVPVRGIDPQEFWRDPLSGARALLVWVLLVGGSLVGAVGTLLTGSGITAAGALVSFLLLLYFSPRHFENR